MGHFVYKYVLNDEIIYIGKNDTDLYSRLYQHGRSGDNIPQAGWDDINSADIYYFETLDNNMSDFLESVLIHRHKPKYNSAKCGNWDGYNSIPEPDWKPVFMKEIRKQSDSGKKHDGSKNYLKPPYTNAKKYILKERFKSLYFKYKEIIPFYEYFEIHLQEFPQEAFILNLPYKGLNAPFYLPQFISSSSWDFTTLKLSVQSNWKDVVKTGFELHEIEKEMKIIDKLLQTYYPDALIEPNRSHISDFYPFYKAYKNRHRISNNNFNNSEYQILNLVDGQHNK